MVRAAFLGLSWMRKEDTSRGRPAGGSVNLPDSYSWQDAIDYTDRLKAENERLREALAELVDASDGIAVYPEGGVGFEYLVEATEEARKLLPDRRGEA
jgi:hypothetical protein